MFLPVMLPTKPGPPRPRPASAPDQLTAGTAPHEQHDRDEHDQHPQRRVGELERARCQFAAPERGNGELVHRVYFGGCGHLLFGPWSGASVRAVFGEPHRVDQPADKGEEHQDDGDPRQRVEKVIEAEADYDPAERVTDHGRNDRRRTRAGADDRRGVLRQAAVLRRTRGSDPVIERIDGRSSRRVLSGFGHGVWLFLSEAGE